MPELPDIALYLHALEPRIVGKRIEAIRNRSPFLVRSVAPPLSSAQGKEVEGLRRIGKRIVWELEGDVFLVFHLMIAGRFQWKAAGAKLPGRMGLAAFDFVDGTLILTEASKKKRASLHVVEGEEHLEDHDPGGLEVLEADLETFRERLTARNHTLKRALTDPRIFSGIGNAYSDEILVRAGLSPLIWTSRLEEPQIERLYETTCETLREWVKRLRDDVGDDFPKKVTAFRPEMAVHGKYGEPCGICGTPVQRIRYADNETNYCPSCQTGGKLLADRGLSRLLKKDWPRSLDQLEALKASHREKLGGASKKKG